MSICDERERMVSAHGGGSACETSKSQISGRPKKSSGWTSERRAKASQAIHAWQPWLKTKGPVTPEGKRRSSMNRYQGGKRENQRKARREVRAAVAAFHAAILEIRVWRWMCARVDAGLSVTEADLATAVMPEVNIFARPDEQEEPTATTRACSPR
jgi:hypothetical protein